MHSEEDGSTENTDSPSARARIYTDFCCVELEARRRCTRRRMGVRKTRTRRVHGFTRIILSLGVCIATYKYWFFTAIISATILNAISRAVFDLIGTPTGA